MFMVAELLIICFLTFWFVFWHFQTWDPWNVPLALSCAVRVFRLLSQVTLLRFVFVQQIYAHRLTSIYKFISTWT